MVIHSGRREKAVSRGDRVGEAIEGEDERGNECGGVEGDGEGAGVGEDVGVVEFCEIEEEGVGEMRGAGAWKLVHGVEADGGGVGGVGEDLFEGGEAGGAGFAGLLDEFGVGLFAGGFGGGGAGEEGGEEGGVGGGDGEVEACSGEVAGLGGAGGEEEESEEEEFGGHRGGQTKKRKTQPGETGGGAGGRAAPTTGDLGILPLGSDRLYNRGMAFVLHNSISFIVLLILLAISAVFSGAETVCFAVAA